MMRKEAYASRPKVVQAKERRDETRYLEEPGLKFDSGIIL
jgi:hypothetical protein